MRRVGIVFLIFAMLISGMSFGENTGILTVRVLNPDGSDYVGSIIIMYCDKDDMGFNRSLEKDINGSLTITQQEASVDIKHIMAYTPEGTHANSVLKTIDYKFLSDENVELQLQAPTFEADIVGEQKDLDLEKMFAVNTKQHKILTFKSTSGHLAYAPYLKDNTEDVVVLGVQLDSNQQAQVGSYPRTFPYNQKGVELKLEVPENNQILNQYILTVYDELGQLVDGAVDVSYYDNDQSYMHPVSVDNGLLVLEKSAFDKEISGKKYFVVADENPSKGNSLAIEVQDWDQEGHEELGIVRIQPVHITGVVRDADGPLKDAYVSMYREDYDYHVKTQTDGSFAVSQAVVNTSENVELSINKSGYVSDHRDVGHNQKDIEVVLEKNDTDTLALLTINVVDVDGAPYTGNVDYTIYDGIMDISKGTMNVAGGTFKTFTGFSSILNDGSIVLVPHEIDQANSLAYDISGIDLSKPNTLNETISFQDTTLEGVVVDPKDSNIDGYVKATYDDGRSIELPITNNKFVAAPLEANDTSDVILKAYNKATDMMSEETVVSYDDQSISLTIDQENIDLTKVISRLDFNYTNDSKKVDGFIQLSNEGEFALAMPEKSTGKLEVKAYDDQDQEISLLGKNIDFTFNTSHAKEPVYNSETKTLEVFEVNGGYHDRFSGSLKIDESTFHINFTTYQGKLGLAKIKNEDGDLLSGEFAYDINYQVSGGGQKGSTTDGIAYNGVLGIPIQNDFVNIDYGYVIVSPKQKINETAYANSIVTNITDKMVDNGNEFFELGDIIVQDPTLTLEATDKDGEKWERASATMNVHYDGVMTGLEWARINVRAIDGSIYLAKFGEGFTDNLDIKVEEMGPISSYPIKLENINVTSGETIPAASNDVKLFIKGNIVQPDGTTVIPAGQGRDTSLNVKGIGDDHHYYESYWFNTVEYGVPYLEVGKKYEVTIRFDQGDFNDVKVTDSIPVIVEVGATPAETVIKDLDGNVIEPRKIEGNSVVVDLKATKPVLRGHVKAGEEFVKNLEVSIYDLNGDKVASANVHNASTPGQDTDEGVFMIGGVEQLSGKYKVVVDAPEDTIDFTGFETEMVFPVEKDVLLELPETKIKGNIVVSDIDEDEFNDRYRRIYVNVFDEYGRYLTNGQVKSNGQFAMGQLDPGRYYAEAFVSPYADVASKYISSNRVFFQVTGEEYEEFDVPLRKKAGTCTVVDTQGSSVQDAWVMIYDEAYNEVTSVKSNEQGQVGIPELKDGKYIIKALATRGLSDSKAYEVTFTNGQYNGTNKLQLTNAQVIGSVYAVEDLTDAQVLVFNEQKQFVAFSKSVGDTPYQVGGLAPGTYFLQAIPVNDVNGFTQSDLVEIQVTTSEQVVDIHLNKVGLTGTVAGPQSEVINDGWVHLYNGDEIVASSKIENGTYQFGELEENKTYAVMADGSNSPFHASEKKIVSNDNVDLTLTASAAIRGKVTLNGDVVEGEEIYLYNGGKEPVASVRTNAYGEYNFDGLAQGDYKVVIKTRSGEALVEDIIYSGTEINLSTKEIQ